MPKRRQPKILFFDIETAPNLAYVWGKYEQNVIAYEKEWQMLSVAYKWRGQRGVSCLSVEGQKSDKALVQKTMELLNSADVVVAHNGDAFDIKKVTARAVFHGLAPAKILATVDTKKVAKRHFAFNGNSLNDLGVFLGLGQKVKHSGFDMWLGCMRDDKRSWQLMRHYNRKDVALLERVYNRFLPWITNHPNIARLLNPDLVLYAACPTCGSTDIRREGYRATSVQIRAQLQCKRCGRWFLGAVPRAASK